MISLLDKKIDFETVTQTKITWLKITKEIALRKSTLIYSYVMMISLKNANQGFIFIEKSNKLFLIAT